MLYHDDVEKINQRISINVEVISTLQHSRIDCTSGEEGLKSLQGESHRTDYLDKV